MMVRIMAPYTSTSQFSQWAGLRGGVGHWWAGLGDVVGHWWEGLGGVLIGDHCPYLCPTDDVEEEEEDGVYDIEHHTLVCQISQWAGLGGVVVHWWAEMVF